MLICTLSCYCKYEKLQALISWFNGVLLCWRLFIFLSPFCCHQVTLREYWVSIRPHSWVWSSWLNGKRGQTLSPKGDFSESTTTTRGRWDNYSRNILFTRQSELYFRLRSEAKQNRTGQNKNFLAQDTIITGLNREKPQVTGNRLLM